MLRSGSRSISLAVTFTMLAAVTGAVALAARAAAADPDGEVAADPDGEVAAGITDDMRRALLERYVPGTYDATRVWVQQTYAGDERKRVVEALDAYRRRWNQGTDEQFAIREEVLTLAGRPAVPPVGPSHPRLEVMDDVEYEVREIAIQEINQKHFKAPGAAVGCMTAVDFVVGSGVTGVDAADGNALADKAAYDLSLALGFSAADGNDSYPDANARIFGARLRRGAFLPFQGASAKQKLAVFERIRIEIDAGRPVHLRVPPMDKKNHSEVIYGYRRNTATGTYDYLLHDVGNAGDTRLDATGQVYSTVDGVERPNRKRATFLGIYPYEAR